MGLGRTPPMPLSHRRRLVFNTLLPHALLAPFSLYQLIPLAAEVFHQQLADSSRFIVHHPVGGILECYQAAILAQINAERGHFVAEVGILLPPKDERRYLDS